MQVSKWGHSLAVRLPSQVVATLELQEGDDIEIVVDSPRKFAVRKKPTKSQWIERLRSLRGRLPADFKFDRNEVNEGG
jgi:antitoxin MazE